MAESDQNDLYPVTAPAGRGAAWLLEGFSLFQKNWLEWIGITIILFLITVLSAIIPFGSFLLNIFIFLFFAGLMLGCREIDQDGEFGVASLFAGFSGKIGEYILLGVLYSVGVLAIMVLVAVLLIVMVGGLSIFTEIQSEIQSGQLDNIFRYAMSVLLAVLIALLLYLPLIMAFWFAPALMALRSVNVFPAMKMSFIACLVNIVPFLLYGLVGLLLSVLASIPLGLGWLILFPMIVTSIYISYKDIFESRKI